MILDFPYADFLKAFFSLFIVMDAFGNLPILMALTQKLSVKERNRNVDMALLVAGALLLIFLFFGTKILNYFGITFESFKVAAGLILMIIGIKLVLGLRWREEHAKNYEMAVVPLSTPLLVGPAVLTVTIILVNQYGYLLTLLAALANLLIAWIVLHQSSLLFKIFGRQGSDLIARVMGLILTALAVELIRQGWAAF